MEQKLKANTSSMGLTWEAVLFAALYVVSPSYFALELSGKLPLLTASRILFVLMGVMLLVRRRREIFPLKNLKLSAWNFGLTQDKFLRTGLMLYFVMRVICDGALLRQDVGAAVKALFTVVVESYGLVWMLALVLDTRQKLLAALKILVLSAGVSAVIAALGCVFDGNPFYILNTVQRDMLMAKYYRLGLLRAEAGFGHPVYYGAFCAIIVPINMYFVEYSERRREKLLFCGCLTMNLVGLVLSNSRGSLCAFACLVVLAAVLKIQQKQFLRFCKTYLPIGFAALVILGAVALTRPAGLAFLRGIFNSMVNTVAPNTVSMDIVVDEETVISYGKNASGGRSRMTQMTGMLWTMQRSPLIGMGTDAHLRGVLCYMGKDGKWFPADTFDVALIAIVCQYGILGLLGYTGLLGSLFRTAWCKKYRQDRLMQYLGLAFVTYLLCLITISSLEKVAWTLFGAMVCLTNIIIRENPADGTEGAAQ